MIKQIKQFEFLKDVQLNFTYKNQVVDSFASYKEEEAELWRIYAFIEFDKLKEFEKLFSYSCIDSLVWVVLKKDCIVINILPFLDLTDVEEFIASLMK